MEEEVRGPYKRRKPIRRYVSTCFPGGRAIEIAAEHREWTDWAVAVLYAKAQEEAVAAGQPSRRKPKTE
jgi:hypothetical protein